MRTIEDIVAKLVRKAGIDSINKKVNPHSTRHGRVTELSNNKVPEAHLRKYAGWKGNSNMTSRYNHPSKKAVIKSVLTADGYTPEEIDGVKTQETPMKPIPCTRCNKENPFDSIYCRNCGNVINEVKILEVQAEQRREEEEKMKQMQADMMSQLRDEMHRALTNITTSGNHDTWIVDEKGLMRKIEVNNNPDEK